MKVDTKILVSVNEDAQIVIEVDDQVYDGVGVVRMGPLVMSRASSAAIAARVTEIRRAEEQAKAASSEGATQP